MTNTLLYIWLDPVHIGFHKAKGKVYFNYITNKDLIGLSKKELDDYIGGGIHTSIVRELMDFADIRVNMDFGVISSMYTKKKPGITITDSPEERENDIKEKKDIKNQEKKLAKIINGKIPINITNDNLEIKDDGTIDLFYPELKLKDNINFPKLWDQLEQNIIGKIKEGDKLEIKDDDGNVVLNITGGSFLNVGLADLSIYDKKTMDKNRSLISHMQGLKGGLFIRKDGSLDIGDTERTFYMRIDTKRLLKLSLKNKLSLNDITSQKLLEQQNKKKNG